MMTSVMATEEDEVIYTENELGSSYTTQEDALCTQPDICPESVSSVSQPPIGLPVYGHVVSGETQLK